MTLNDPTSQLLHGRGGYRTHIRFVALFLLFIVWQSAGIFPAVSYEGDALSISAGCEYTFREGWSTLGEKGYGYWMQPLTYLLILIVKHLLPQFSCEAIYSVASSLAAVGMQLLVILFASGISGVRRETVLLAIVLIPESYMLAMYPNSLAFSGLIYIGGLMMLFNRRPAVAACLLAVAPLFRLDVLIAYPAIPGVMMLAGYSCKRSLLASAIYAAVLIPFLYGAYSLLGADVTLTATEHSRWGDIVPIRKNVMAILGFYGLPAIMLMFASLSLIRNILHRRNGRIILILCWGMILLVHIVQFRFGNASKHFAMLIPFVVILTAIELSHLISNYKRILSAIIFSVIPLLLFIGLRVGSGKKFISQSLLNSYNPTLAEYKFRIGGNPASIVIGGGQAAMTADEAILTSGSIFYPFFIHNLKEANLGYRERAIDEISSNAGSQVIYAAWEELATLDLLSTERCIPADRLTQDMQLFSYIQEIENPEVRREMTSYVKEKYFNRPETVLFVSTESTSHRWRNALLILGEQDIIEPTDKTGAVYLIKKNLYN